MIDVVLQTEKAYREIKRKILDSEWQPGTKLVASQLSEEFSMSRTPIRESFNVLKKEGLVEHIPGLGVYVKKLNRDEVLEMYEVREALEGISARLASLKANESDLHKIKCAVESMEESLKKEKEVDIEAYNNADNEFHRLIVEASHNKKLKDLASMCHMHVDDFLPETTRTEFFKEEYKEVLEKHRDILTAIKDRKSDMAEELIRKHISASSKIAETFFEKSGESDKRRIF